MRVLTVRIVKKNMVAVTVLCARLIRYHCRWQQKKACWKRKKECKRKNSQLV